MDAQNTRQLSRPLERAILKWNCRVQRAEPTWAVPTIGAAPVGIIAKRLLRRLPNGPRHRLAEGRPSPCRGRDELTLWSDTRRTALRNRHRLPIGCALLGRIMAGRHGPQKHPGTFPGFLRGQHAI